MSPFFCCNLTDGAVLYHFKITAEKQICAPCREKKIGVECLCANELVPYYTAQPESIELPLVLPLYYKDVLHVLNNGNLSDIIINNFAALVSLNRYEFAYKIVNTFLWGKIKESPYTREEKRVLNRWLDKIFPLRELEKLKLIIFPINVPGQHWYLGAVDISNQQFLYIDSLGHNYAVDFFIKARLFMGLLYKHRNLIFSPVEWRDKRCITPQQQDLTSCGVAVCLAMESLTARRELNYDQVFGISLVFSLFARYTTTSTPGLLRPTSSRTLPTD